MDDILNTSGINFEGDFITQVNNILQYIRMSCQFEVFGSVVTGLALKNSDLDLLCHLRPWFNQPRAVYVIQARKILKSYSTRFRNVLAITKAKVPIVKFYHIPTQRRCDLSFSGPLAAHNSQLLEYYMLSDERVLQLALIVKYWSKIHHFTGENLMPNYCLTLLVVFYLQQKNILCPFISLQQKDDVRIVDVWNTAFTRIPNKCDTTESLYSLLGGFFKYYHNLKFDQCVISLYTGRLIEREKFSDIQSVPQEYESYCANVRSELCQPIRLDTCMCVQDPITHSRNCAVAVHPKLAERIIDLFKNAVDLYDKESSNNFLRNLLYTEESPTPTHKPFFRKDGNKSFGITKLSKRNQRSNQRARNCKRKFNNNKNRLNNQQITNN
ncbi:poly(A) RNA polymerase, mitochondrial isoform X2 [Zerene cesonia]|uniref:poly(A) RNA polymerase, mitochondrial isoform X2 n=2 Tax=Zerene cesonia TaxID=33412 RepID=UPI0018E4E868|nr:poly(A) RNA polymerase, mitochondrial isoform X2 [Zerene cesonia]